MSAPSYPGVERLEARFAGDAYSLHRHDTYAIGVTLSGVQTFWYRGERRSSLPGQVIVLHPDEVHDGGAGDLQGLLYRMAYIDPALVNRALEASATLPFVADPVLSDSTLRQALSTVLSDLDTALEPIAVDEATTEIAAQLQLRSGAPARHLPKLDSLALARTKDYLEAITEDGASSATLEAVSGLDRFTLTRQFKVRYGTTPHRYQLMRRLAAGRRMLSEGSGIADAAVASGFYDQSHFHRHFLTAFGVTPGRWRLLAGRSKQRPRSK